MTVFLAFSHLLSQNQPTGFPPNCQLKSKQTVRPNTYSRKNLSRILFSSPNSHPPVSPCKQTSPRPAQPSGSRWDPRAVPHPRPYRRPSFRKTRSSLSAAPAPPASLPSSRSPWPSPQPSRTFWSPGPRLRRPDSADGWARSPLRPPPASLSGWAYCPSPIACSGSVGRPARARGTAPRCPRASRWWPAAGTARSPPQAPAPPPPPAPPAPRCPRAASSPLFPNHRTRGGCREKMETRGAYQHTSRIFFKTFTPFKLFASQKPRKTSDLRAEKRRTKWRLSRQPAPWVLLPLSRHRRASLRSCRWAN